MGAPLLPWSAAFDGRQPQPAGHETRGAALMHALLSARRVSLRSTSISSSHSCREGWGEMCTDLLRCRQQQGGPRQEGTPPPPPAAAAATTAPATSGSAALLLLLVLQGSGVLTAAGLLLGSMCAAV